MTGPLQNTVERLDRPSAYYLAKVCTPRTCFSMAARLPLMVNGLQNKKRKFNRDREDKDEPERTPEEQEDPLKDATTLYVGNLYVAGILFGSITKSRASLRCSGLSIRQKSRFTSCLQSKAVNVSSMISRQSSLQMWRD